MGGSFHQDATLLFGRDKELELLHAFVDQSSSTGATFLLSGAPGVGKTVLLDAVAVHAADAGLRVLRAAGAEFEADLSFAGLNQVLHPLFDELEGLNPPQRAALEVALGLGDGPAPDQLVVCSAGLSLLANAGSKEPLLVIVDDLQWVDRAERACARVCRTSTSRHSGGVSGGVPLGGRELLRAQRTARPRPRPARRCSLDRIAGRSLSRARPAGAPAASRGVAGQPARPLGASSRTDEHRRFLPRWRRRKPCRSADASKRSSLS